MAPPEDPVAAVVVATYNRSEQLHALVAGLEQQRDVGPFEVIIVDDGSRDGTWAELERLAATSSVSLRPLRLEANAGPATARNAGWRASRAPVICFTDDDCVPQPGWLAGLLGALTDDVDIVQGHTVPNPAHAFRRGPFSHTIWVFFEEGYYETCNIAYRREVLERLGGFNQTFRRAYGEDIDLAWRAKESGARTAFGDDALVFHEVTPSDYRAFVREIKRRPSLVRSFKDHPGVRKMLGKGIFFRPTHPRALLVAAAGIVLLFGLGSPVRWLIALILGLVYAWDIRKFRPKPPRKVHWLAIVPLSFVGELYEIGVMAVASIRYRTLVL
jgi:glycosyltransferase involved in cell wall biosynthesis